jgi:hypothetical protein
MWIIVKIDVFQEGKIGPVCGNIIYSCMKTEK